MALKYILASWKRDLRVNPFHRFNFYSNPRNRVFQAINTTGSSFIKNGSNINDNMRGTYRMQTTSISAYIRYLYTMPQRFIIEGWIKPEFAYNVASNQTIFQCGNASEFSIIYNATTDCFDMIQSPGTTISTTAFATTSQLNEWLYIRAWYDNTSKLAGFYVTRQGATISDAQNVPGVGTFVPLNTIIFFDGVLCQSSYWIIHELDEALGTGEYKTYDADRQIIFDFNGTTLGRERLDITRFVKSFSISESIENTMSRSAGANSASLILHNTLGQFSDDQYDAFDPFNGYYNGLATQKYLQNRCQVEIESNYQYFETPLYPSDTLYPSDILYPSGSLNTSIREPLFIGRTTPGSFKRTSPSHFYGSVTINVEDGVAEIGETKLATTVAYDTYDLSDPTTETSSLFHCIARTVTKKPMQNYVGNSGFELTTIANSWENVGMTTFERSNTYAQFGTYSMKCVADGTNTDYVRQRIAFNGADKVDVGDAFNLSGYINTDTASSVALIIHELDAGLNILSQASVVCGTTTGIFNRINVGHRITSSSCTIIGVLVYALLPCTLYADDIMLTRGFDAMDTVLVGSHDGAAGLVDADDSVVSYYDTVAIDAEAVDVSHPYAIVSKGETPWEHLKQIGDASLASYLGMSPDGVLSFRVRYNQLNEDNLGTVDNVATISTALTNNAVNSVKVHGIIIEKEPTPTTVFEGNTGMTKHAVTGQVYHPVADGAYLAIQGCTEIEFPYDSGDA